MVHDWVSMLVHQHVVGSGKAVGFHIRVQNVQRIGKGLHDALVQSFRMAVPALWKKQAICLPMSFLAEKSTCRMLFLMSSSESSNRTSCCCVALLIWARERAMYDSWL